MTAIYDLLAASHGLFQQRLHEYGAEHQLRLLQEECAELTAAVSHYFRARADSRTELCEELCDVLIMCMQAVTLFEPSELEQMFYAKMHKLSTVADAELRPHK